MFRSSLKRFLASSGTLTRLASSTSLSCASATVRPATFGLSSSPCGRRLPQIGMTSLSAAALTLAYRHGGSVSRRPGWRATSKSASWRQSSTAKKKLSDKKKSPLSKSQKATPPQRVKAASPSRSIPRSTRNQPSKRRGKKLRKLSPYQRQTEKYNKRVLTIARLWKEQQQGVQKQKKSLASRLK